MALGKLIFRVLGWRGGFWADGPFSIGPLPSAPERGTRQRFYFIFFKFFAECHVPWHSAKASLTSAKGGTRQINLFFVFFGPIFFVGPCYGNYISISKFGTILSFFTIFH